MNSSGVFSFRRLRLGLIGILLACATYGGSSGYGCSDTRACRALSTHAQATPPLSADDVSWLFPAPTRAEDFAKLIAVRDLTTQNAQDPTKRDLVWPYTVFQQFLAITASPAAQVAGTQIALPAEAQFMDAWFIAAIRIDAGAPGLSNDIRAQFGQLPEIRLIIQPVTRKPDGTPQVRDIAVHLIFDFKLKNSNDPASSDCSRRPIPDLDTFNTIVADLAALRTKLSDGQFGAHKVTTSGVPLGVHPGLADATTALNLREEMKSFLEKYISGQRLDAMAIAGLPAGKPAPWIFLAMLNLHPGDLPALPNGGLVPVPGPTLDGQQFAQMLEPSGTSFQVVPEPHTNNLNPITCKNAAKSATSLPIASRIGDATTEVFVNPALPTDKTKEILDVIADPNKSHFFNTDCVSCHTDTRLARDILKITNVPGIDSAALPKDSWNVRNFGWSPAGGLQATVTRRTAAETAAVVTFINSELLAKKAAPSR
jgi:hypothetical protein